MPALADFYLLFLLSFLFTQAFGFFRASTFDNNLYLPYFTLILAYLLVSLPKIFFPSLKRSSISKIKLVLFFLIVALTLGKTFYSAINLRYQIGNSYPVHDNPIQLEEAVKLLKQGKNPYTENYLNTPLADWLPNSASPLLNELYHFITLPFYLLLSFILFFPFTLIFGYFDQRMVHAIFLIISTYLIFKLSKTAEKTVTYLSLFLFNPLFIHYFIEGRNEVFVFTLVFLSLYLLKVKKIFFSFLVLGLAVASKQSSWLLIPFSFCYLFFQSGKKTLMKTAPFFITVLLLFLPFLFWDAKSFIDDIYHFPAGTITTSYPIHGMGLSALLLSKGIIAKDIDYFPFGLVQIIIGIPILIFLINKLKKHQTISFIAYAYGLFLFVFWLFSRFFYPSYVGYLSLIFLIASLFDQQRSIEKLPANKNKLIAKKVGE